MYHNSDLKWAKACENLFRINLSELELEFSDLDSHVLDITKFDLLL